MKTDAVLRSVNELRQAVTASVLQLAITERNQRLIALQERWDALREAKAALAREDYAAAMKTGVVCRRIRWIGGKDGYEVTEYEINTALIRVAELSREARVDRDWPGSGPRRHQPAWESAGERGCPAQGIHPR
jgi:hypothetical protein